MWSTDCIIGVVSIGHKPAQHHTSEVYTAVNSCCDGELVLLLGRVGARPAHACLPMHIWISRCSYGVDQLGVSL